MADPLDFSFEDQGATPVAPDALARLNARLEEAIDLKQMLDQMEADVSATKQQLHLLNTTVIPDMMTELGMDEVTQRGWNIKVNEFVSGSLPKEDVPRMKAIRWLEAHDGADLLKTSMTVEFSRSQHNEALNLAGQIQEQGYAPIVESSVHAQTLMAYARQRLKDGDPLDTEVLGLYTGRVAKFKKIEEKKPRKPRAPKGES